MKPFLYERLTQALLAEMASGMHSEGTRFLSLRKIRSLWNVSEPTAQSAIQILIDENLVIAAPRSGLVLTEGFQKRALLLLHKSHAPTLPPPSTWESKRGKLLHSQRSNTPRFAIIFAQGNGGRPNPADLAALEASRIFFQEALKKGADVEYFCQDGSPTREDLILEELQQKPFDGIACFRRFATQKLKPFIETLLPLRIPVLALFDDCEQVAASSVNFNNIGAGYDGMRILLENGHRNIVVLTTSSFVENLEQRLEGCRLAIAESPFASEATLTVCRIPTTGLSRSELQEAFITPPHPPTALFACGISSFLQLEPLLQTLGLTVPQDLSVLGCGSRSLLPPKYQHLDLMRCDFQAAGKLAFQHLWNLRKGTPTNRAVLIPTPYERAGSIRNIASPAVRSPNS